MRYLLILICVVFGGGELCAQPAVAFETKTYDLGEVGEKGGAVSRDFRFENTGDAPLVIIKAETACNCTKVRFSRKPVAPGRKGTVTVVYDPAEQDGSFLKAVKILTNTPEKQYIVTIRGNVVP